MGVVKSVSQSLLDSYALGRLNRESETQGDDLAGRDSIRSALNRILGLQMDSGDGTFITARDLILLGAVTRTIQDPPKLTIKELAEVADGKSTETVLNVSMADRCLKLQALEAVEEPSDAESE